VDLDGSVARQYPHNLLLETSLESGWLCGTATAAVLAAALASAARGGGDAVLFAGLVFCAVNALVSGDVNDNRALMAFLGAALSRWPDPGRAS
jgi:hypothetical protein